MKPGITVHHISEKGVKADLHLYCGRGKSPRPDLTAAGLGNPYQMFYEHQRDRVCESYAKMLKDNKIHPHWRLIRRIGEHVSEGKRVALYCYCSPKRCHCGTIQLRALSYAVLLNPKLSLL